MMLLLRVRFKWGDAGRRKDASVCCLCVIKCWKEEEEKRERGAKW